MQLRTFAREVAQVEASGRDGLRHHGVNVGVETKMLVFVMTGMLLEACPSRVYDAECPGGRFRVSSFDGRQVVERDGQVEERRKVGGL